MPKSVARKPKAIVKPTSNKYRFDRRKSLSPEEESELWVAFKQGGDISARDLIVRCNLHYVVTIAKMMNKTSTSLESAVAEGNYGLMRAIEGFEPERGSRFITYAAYWIRTYISKYLQSSRTILNKPLVTSKIIYRVRRERARATNSVGDAPDAVASIVSTKLGLTVDKVHDLFERLDCHDVSLDSKPFADSADSMVDTLLSTTPTPDEVLEHNANSKVQQSKVADALSLLTPREKTIIEERFMTDEPLALSELGRRFGVSRERVRQLEERSVRRLRQALAGIGHQTSVVGQKRDESQ
jgi:RNA polymerase sigma-32 factor